MASKTKTYHHGNLKEALISAGLEILTEKGIEGLSLRSVAKRIGVSHAAPYNHFPDKQALLAAMSTAGHEKFHQTLIETFEKFKDTSPEIIVEIGWAYLQFAKEDPGRFKLMFSPKDLITLWDVETGREVATLPGERGFIVHIGFSPDGHTLFATSFEGITQLWRAPSREEIEAAEKGKVTR